MSLSDSYRRPQCICISLDLWAKPASKNAPQHIQNLTLEVLNSHIEPGILVVALEDPETKKSRPDQCVLHQVVTGKVPKTKSTFKRGAAERSFTPKSSIRYFLAHNV